MASTINYEIYNRMTEYSQDDIAKVNRWEDEEQQRRIADTLGEQQRRENARLVSDIISTSLRPNWFQRGSAFVLDILRVAREAGNEALSSSQIIKFKLQNKAQNTAQDAKLKLHETSQDVKAKFQETSNDVKTKLQTTSQDVKLKVQEKINSAQDVANTGLEKVQGVAQQGFGKVQEAAKMVRSASLKAIKRVKSAFTSLSENTHLAFAVLEEENERAWRMNGDNEVFAVLNALRVSSLIKDTAPALYRPAFEPTRKYSTRLLEENERSRRALEDLANSTSRKNAKAVADIVTEKYRVLITPFPAKQEKIEEIHVTRAPAPTAAM